MKKYLLFTIAILCYASISQAQLYMDSGGDVRIGTSSSDPTYKLDVRGNMSITCTPGANSGLYLKADGSYPAIIPQWNNSARLGVWSYKYYYMYTNYLYYDNLVDWSDLNIKENIREIEKPLSSVLKINGIKYDRKREFYINTPEADMDIAVASGKNKYGVVAQELLEIYPDLVTYNEDAQMYAVNYVGLIPILVEAIKEQQAQIDDLQKAVNSYLKDAAAATLGINSQLPPDGLTTLNQNTPNPFTEETIISYSLSNDVNTAFLFIYDMSGKQLRSYELHQRGNAELRIIGGELEAGMYMYSLIVDGQLLRTKQMILTEQ